MGAHLSRACRGYLPGIGPRLRASLLGSRENDGLIPLREPRVSGDRYAVAVIPAGHVTALAS